MARRPHLALTDTAIKNAKPQDKDYYLNDGDGLQLLVTSAGGKRWHYRYRFEGKERAPYTMGRYPEVGLKDARKLHAKAREMLSNGIDPNQAKKEEKAAKEAATTNNFEAVAHEWLATWAADKAETHSRNVKSRLENYVFRWIGTRPVAEINAPEILECLRRVERIGFVEAAKRVKAVISQVMRYAIATGKRIERDPCPDLKGALQTRPAQHMPTLTKLADVAELMRKIGGYQETPRSSVVICAALKLSPLLFVRPGELISMRWADIDLDKAEWTYTVSKTKTEHHVPLSRQSVAILASLRELTGHTEWVFPHQFRHERHMSNESVNRALQAIGYDTKTEITAHGFRATARTLLAEQLHFPPEVIEHQLAHKVPDTLGRAYNRTKYLTQRKEMMQRWSDFLLTELPAMNFDESDDNLTVELETAKD